MARAFNQQEAESWVRLHEEYPVMKEVSDMTQSTFKLDDSRSQPSERRLSHTNDVAPAKQAGKAMLKVRTELQNKVIDVLKKEGPMTDDDLGYWFLVNHEMMYDKGTIRKRRSELFQMGLVRKAGVGKSDRGKPMTKWEVV